MKFASLTRIKLMWKHHNITSMKVFFSVSVSQGGILLIGCVISISEGH